MSCVTPAGRWRTRSSPASWTRRSSAAALPTWRRTCVPALDRLDVENSIESALRKVRAEAGSATDKPDARRHSRCPISSRPRNRSALAELLDRDWQGAAGLCLAQRRPGRRAVVVDCPHALSRGDRLHAAAARSARRPSGAASRPCSGSSPSWCRGRCCCPASARRCCFARSRLQPVLLLDEADNAGLKHNEDLRDRPQRRRLRARR